MAVRMYHAVPGGDESSDSDDGWDLGEMRELKMKLNNLSVIASNEDTFKKALTTGNVKLAEDLLNSGVSVECSFKFGWTPLMYAASVGNLEIVRLLLDRGANACFEKDKFTVLMSACTAHSSEENIVKCVELLLSRNADPNVACRKGMTPIMLSAREGHTQVVSLLVAHGADINAQDENGYTGLTWAAHDGWKNTVLKFLELGADKSLSTKNGETPAEMARKHNHLEIFSILSFSGNMGPEKSNLTKEEAVYRYLRMQPDLAVTSASCYSSSSDLEVFLHGLNLEHLTELFKDTDITLRQFLTLEEVELKKVGITDAEDCKKIIAAVKEIEVGETKPGEFPKFLDLESNCDELFAFLLKLNRQCSSITQTVEAINAQIPLNAHKIVLEWDSTQNFLTVCEDIVRSVDDLGTEVCRLQCLLQKFQNGQKKAPCRVSPLDEQMGWRKSKLLKITAGTVLTLSLIIFIVKGSVRKTFPLFID